MYKVYYNAEINYAGWLKAYVAHSLTLEEANELKSALEAHAGSSLIECKVEPEQE